MILRRSVYITENIKKGDRLTKENIGIIRPGLGLDPKYYDIVLGKQIRRDAAKGTPVSWDLI